MLGAIAAETRDSAIKTVFDELEPPYQVVNPDVGDVSQLIAALDSEQQASTCIIGQQRVLKQIRKQFRPATLASELRENDGSILAVDQGLNGKLFVGAENYYAVASPNQGKTLVGTDNNLDTILEEIDELRSDANSFRVTAPSPQRLTTTMSEMFNQEMVNEFTEIVESDWEIARKTNIGVVEILLILSARYDEQLYTVSTWGERVGIASKATFSRIKTDLEEKEVLSTEKVPVDLGRPRQQLVLEADELEEAAPPEIYPRLANLLG